MGELHAVQKRKAPRLKRSTCNSSVIDVPMFPTKEELLAELRHIRDTTPPLMLSGADDSLIDARNGHRAARGWIAYVLHTHSRLDAIVRILEQSDDD